MGSGGGSSGPTLQQQQLETSQALTTANLNLEENSQRKSILNAMQGTRVFRESALSRAVRGNTPGGTPAPGPSAAQTSAVISPTAFSLFNPINGPQTNTTGKIATTREAGTAGGGVGPSGSGITGRGTTGGGGRQGAQP